MTAPRRRWLRLAFSLRTMFALITVLCCWLGYQLNWIRQRHAVLNDGVAVSEFDARYQTRPPAPLPLSLLGETGHALVRIVIRRPGRFYPPVELTPEEILTQGRLKQIFPEAEVAESWSFYENVDKNGKPLATSD